MPKRKAHRAESIAHPQITPVPSSGATPVPSSGATEQAGQAQITQKEMKNYNGGRWRVVTLFIDFVHIIPWAQGIKRFKVSERRLLQNYEIDIMNFKVIS